MIKEESVCSIHGLEKTYDKANRKTVSEVPTLRGICGRFLNVVNISIMDIMLMKISTVTSVSGWRKKTKKIGNAPE